jgi:hypothetical protein
MNKSEFARHCGVTPPSVQSAVADKRIVVSSNGMVDANHPKNVAYYNHQKERKTKLSKGRGEATPYANRIPENRPRITGPPMDASSVQCSNDDPFDPERDPADELAAPDSNKSEIDYAIEKMRSTTAINKARLAEMVRATVRRDFVDRVIAMIGTTISYHLLTMGDRLSPDLAALAGSTEAAVVRKIKHALDHDVSTTLGEMQRVVAERYEKHLED